MKSMIYTEKENMMSRKITVKYKEENKQQDVLVLILMVLMKQLYLTQKYIMKIGIQISIC